MSFRAWSGITIYDPVPEWKAKAREIALKDRVKYLVLGREECPTTHRVHLQGHLRLRTTCRRKAVQKLLEPLSSASFTTHHVEPARGSDEEGREYCTKDGDFFEHGQMASPGTRSDLTNLTTLIRTGVSLRECYETHPEVTHRTMRATQIACGLYHRPRRTWKTHCLILWGQPETGKSRRAWTAYPDAYAMPAPTGSSGGWFDDYEGQSEVIIDDFYGWIKWTTFLQMADRYPMKVPTKGGHADFLAKVIVITSNANPERWYHYDDRKLFSALERRCTIVHVVSPDQEVLFPSFNESEV